jgi:hypothetical protein
MFNQVFSLIFANQDTGFSAGAAAQPGTSNYLEVISNVTDTHANTPE